MYPQLASERMSAKNYSLTRTYYTTYRRNLNYSTRGPISNVLSIIGFLLLASAFSMPWVQSSMFLQQKLTLSDMYSIIFSGYQLFPINPHFVVSSITSLLALILYPIAVFLAFTGMLGGRRTSLPGWLATTATFLWYVSIEAFKAEATRTVTVGNPFTDSIARALIYQSIGIDYGVTVASIGGILLIIAGWLRG